jgi:hypothetical protein
MCMRCRRPPAVPPKQGTCSRCGTVGTCWEIQRRWGPPTKVCYVCIAHALLASA